MDDNVGIDRFRRNVQLLLSEFPRPKGTRPYLPTLPPQADFLDTDDIHSDEISTIVTHNGPN